MSKRAAFLHVTDAHLSSSGVSYRRDDVKFRVPQVAEGTREEAFRLLMSRVAERVRMEGLPLEAVLFSGDAQHMGKPGGHELLLELLREHLFPLGLTEDRIVAVAGNHDVRRDTPPSSGERYEDFLGAWGSEGCIVPWLDGIHPRQGFDHDRHRLLASDRSWAVYPVNTSNWSNVTVPPPEPLGSRWAAIPEALADGDEALADELRRQLQSLLRYDMCRVSPEQLEVLRAIVASTPKPDNGKQLRMVVMHHHMRSPDLGEELKPFSDMSNLEQFRAFLRGSGIDVVLHGHKHVQAAYLDHISADGDLPFQRTLVVSGSTFELRSEMDAVRLVTLEGLPHTPQVKLEPIALPRSGAEQPRPRPVIQRLWTTTAQTAQGVAISENAPIVVEGSDLDEVYARVVDLAKTDAKGGTLIAHLELPEDDTSLPLPRAYAVPSDIHVDERQSWLRELVEWWQLGRSQLEPRIPYLHGARLQRYGGKIDQIARIIALLRQKPSTRALAVLVDPFRDFTPDGIGEEFASFCLVEFRRREIEPGRIIVDAIAFYRAQEFERWWPINIAELRLLQTRICGELGFKPGRITTIAADARTISRSPTQVAMPIVDRWLDQAPERLHLLADALVRGAVSGEAQSSAVREWRRSLSELRLATNAYNADGIPVAIDGLRILAAYLSAAAPAGDGELAELARSIGHLANANTTFGQPNRTRADFDSWSPVAKAFLSSVEAISERRLPSGTNDPNDGHTGTDQH